MKMVLVLSQTLHEQRLKTAFPGTQKTISVSGATLSNFIRILVKNLIVLKVMEKASRLLPPKITR